jgi:hypothetical protein
MEEKKEYVKPEIEVVEMPSVLCLLDYSCGDGPCTEEIQIP